MHVLKLDSDGLFFSVLFCSSFCPSSSAPPHPHVPNRRPRGPFPRQTQNRMTDRRTRGPETCPRAAATAAPAAAAPQPPSRPHHHQRLLLLLLATKRYRALVYRLLFVYLFLRKNGKNLKLLCSAWRWSPGSPGSNLNPAEAHRRRFVDFHEIWIGSSKQTSWPFPEFLISPLNRVMLHFTKFNPMNLIAKSHTGHLFPTY